MIHGNEFEDLRIVLDNIMKERCAENIGTTRKQADLISYEYEEEMWQKNILGEDNPDKLRSTVLFLLGINLALRAVDEHYLLRRDMPEKRSQISFENNSKGVKCVVFREDHCTKTNDGGIDQMHKERKIVWIYPSKNINRCPVRLVEKYLGLCPKNYFKKSNFYLQSLRCPTPKQWYGREVLGANKVKEVVKELLSSAKIDGYFTNHSLRRCGSTRLFQAGIDRKLVKEVTGHRSDAVDCYQITSEAQREKLSNIIACPSVPDTVEPISKEAQVTNNSVSEDHHEPPQCTCKCQRHESRKVSVGEIINETIEKHLKDGKTIIKVEIEINNV